MSAAEFDYYEPRSPHRLRRVAEIEDAFKYGVFNYDILSNIRRQCGWFVQHPVPGTYMVSGRLCSFVPMGRQLKEMVKKATVTLDGDQIRRLFHQWSITVNYMSLEELRRREWGLKTGHFTDGFINDIVRYHADGTGSTVFEIIYKDVGKRPNETLVGVGGKRVIDTRPHELQARYVMYSMRHIGNNSIDNPTAEWPLRVGTVMPNIPLNPLVETILDNASTGDGTCRRCIARKLSSPDGKRCFVCYKPHNGSCSKCKATWYCSQTCQAAHWNQHKKNCKSLSTIMASLLSFAGNHAKSGNPNAGTI